MNELKDAEDKVFEAQDLTCGSDIISKQYQRPHSLFGNTKRKTDVAPGCEEFYLAHFSLPLLYFYEVKSGCHAPYHVIMSVTIYRQQSHLTCF